MCSSDGRFLRPHALARHPVSQQLAAVAPSRAVPRHASRRSGDDGNARGARIIRLGLGASLATAAAVLAPRARRWATAATASTTSRACAGPCCAAGSCAPLCGSSTRRFGTSSSRSCLAAPASRRCAGGARAASNRASTPAPVSRLRATVAHARLPPIIGGRYAALTARNCRIHGCRRWPERRARPRAAAAWLHCRRCARHAGQRARGALCVSRGDEL